MTKSSSSTRVTSLADYVRRVEARGSNPKQVYFYRGHGSQGHILKQILFRTPSNCKHEKNILRELVSVPPSEFSSDQGAFEQIVRMQHFSLPTRLLDLTSNPLVALYFCFMTSQESPGEVVRIIANAEAVKYYDTKTVSCVANLADLSGKERDELRSARTDADLKESGTGQILLQFIKSEKPYFLALIKRNHLDGPLVVKPRLSNKRLLAQQGEFLLFVLKTKLDDNNLYGYKIDRTNLSVEGNSKIRVSLDKMGINESTMFLEIESAARYIMSKVTSAEVEEEGS